VGENEAAVGPGDGVLIPSREPHKIWNSGDQDLEFLATWVPAWEPKNTVWLETLTE
jgi:mannose-6-phosphate isomerase-like protein (cupin superfamily)